MLSQRLVEFLLPSSLISGFLYVALICGVMALVWSLIPVIFIRRIFVFIFPVGISYFIYWSPVWFMGSDSSEYWSWELLFVGSWSLVGIMVSVAVSSQFNKYRLKRAQHE